MPPARRREKELASHRRAGWSARTSIRERQRATVKAQWRLLVVFGAAMLVLFGVAAVFADGPLQRGLIVGCGVTLAACAVAALVVLSSGTAPLVMCEMAEQWTAQELRPLSEHDWKLVNHFGLGPGDQDHVVVGLGGVVLVETKWGGTPWDVDAGDISFRLALEQTARNAKQLSLWHGVAKQGRSGVKPVLVVWGPAARKLRELPARRHQSGVVVMSGDQLQEWMLRRGRDRLTAAQVDGIFEEIDRHLVRRDARERTSRPMPRSLAEMVWATTTGLGLGVAGFLLTHALVAPACRVPAGLDRCRPGARRRRGAGAQAHPLAVGGAIVPGQPRGPLPADRRGRGSGLRRDLSPRLLRRIGDGLGRCQDGEPPRQSRAARGGVPCCRRPEAPLRTAGPGTTRRQERRTCRRG